MLVFKKTRAYNMDLKTADLRPLLTPFAFSQVLVILSQLRRESKMRDSFDFQLAQSAYTEMKGHAVLRS